MDNEKAQKLIYTGFSQHDCDSYYKCPQCGETYNGWWIWKENLQKKEYRCKCGTLLLMPD